MAQRVSRSALLRGGLGVAGAAILAACGAPVTSQQAPTTVPAKPTDAPEPAAGPTKPAAAPTATSAPAATKPAAAASGAPAPATGAASAGGSAEDEKLIAEAKKEGKVVWWTAHYEQAAAEVMRDAFRAKHQGIEVELLRQTAQVVYQRITQNLKSNVKEVDVFASTDESHYSALKKQNALATYAPAGLDVLPKDFQNIDPDHTYHIG